ncbi:MAG: GspH/FimT family pseudopilin [bacterium]|nr:GspH/FimT family pseudopilin [bacterium]
MMKYSGFTLMEAMVVLAISAIVLAMAVPGMQEMQRRVRISTGSDDLANLIAYAKTSSVTQRRNIVVTRSVVGADTQVDITYDTAAGQMLRRGTFAAPMAVTVEAPTTTLTSFVILPSGQVRRADTNVASDITLRVCDSSTLTETGRDIVIGRLGRIQATKHADATTCNP